MVSNKNMDPIFYRRYFWTKCFWNFFTLFKWEIWERWKN